MDVAINDVVKVFFAGWRKTDAKIFLFGGLARAGKWIIEPAKKSMEKHLFPVYRNKIDIVPSALLDRNIAVLGAAALGWKNLDNGAGE